MFTLIRAPAGRRGRWSPAASRRGRRRSSPARHAAGLVVRAPRTRPAPVGRLGQYVVHVAEAGRARAPGAARRGARAPAGRRCRRRGPELPTGPGQLAVELLGRPGPLPRVHRLARQLQVVEVERRDAEPIEVHGIDGTPPAAPRQGPHAVTTALRHDDSRLCPAAARRPRWRHEGEGPHQPRGRRPRTPPATSPTRRCHSADCSTAGCRPGRSPRSRHPTG